MINIYLKKVVFFPDLDKVHALYGGKGDYSVQVFVYFVFVFVYFGVLKYFPEVRPGCSSLSSTPQSCNSNARDSYVLDVIDELDWMLKWNGWIESSIVTKSNCTSIFHPWSYLTA